MKNEHHEQSQTSSSSEGKEKNEQKILPLQEYEQLISRLQELESMREKLLLHAADFENAKKRLSKEKEEFLKFGQENLIRSFLPTLDNFERALSHRQENDVALKNMLTGIQMIYKQLTETLRNQGLKRQETQGKMFDPHLHEAVSFVKEPGKENEIIEEIDPGYMLHDRLLRAAKVKVRAPHEDSASETASDDDQLS